ncbi:MAG: 6-carboxytetrahydropterin synthase [Azospirillum sp.]|jgi:6-pyruvoyl-tetrahydropterin synthase|nr:6-carboxytetrahydropterin synthase [Azospirillum sp.]MCA3264489.1 6-carboxytetrahydropterin synthase [Azospirillum sp.]MCZ8122053.1 6-carboxytetrahydropterin synthase [Magnetospirillum sp.]
MYSLTVQDHIMIAHSFKGEIFGPAQRVHGATFVVEWELRRPRLDQYGLIADIGLMKKALRAALDEIDYRNLDEIEALKDANTTTEFLCGLIFELLKARVAKGELQAADFAAMKITLRESPVAWAAFEGPLS